MNTAQKIKFLAIANLWLLVLSVRALALDPNQPASSFLRTHFTSTEGLPGSVVGHMGQTKDGFLWMVIESNILTRFDGKNFYLFPTPRAINLAVAPDGDLWVGTALPQKYESHLDRVSTGSGSDLVKPWESKIVRKYRTLTTDQVATAPCTDPIQECFQTLEAKLVGTNEELIRIPSSSLNQFELTGMTSYHPGPGKASQINCLKFGKSGVLWVGTADGLFRTFTTTDGISGNSISRVFEDSAGVIWVGTQSGLDRMVGDRFVHFESLPKTRVIPIGEDREGGLFASVEIDAQSVTRRVDKDRTDTINDLATVDLIQMKRGELWFCGGPIIRMQPSSLKKPHRRDEPLDYETFSISDGLATTDAPSTARCLALTPDDKLWASTPKGLAMLDLRRLQVTNEKPSIYLTDVIIGRNSQPAGREVELPPGTNHVEIHFAAVIEVSARETIRLQYRLDGVDTEWLDAPSNPNAIYSRIPVGTHQLHIHACNRNGIWDRQGVVFSITQKPYFYQTRWFVAAMVALGFLLVFLIYRLRVAQISRQISARFDERLAERTRVAREFHDTFLQTVQGSKMVADHALKNSADHNRMLRAMEQLSTWLGQATEEGRATLLSLRSSTTEKNDLAESFRRAINECSIDNTAEISFSVKGNFVELHPVVRDEIYRIGYEAIRNSCAHSRADRLNVSLEYAHDLTLRIGDNGVGIDPEVVDKGKEGHFGLRGMRERAERIDSKLTLASSPDSGTVITLVVPGRIAFRMERRTWSERLKSLFNISP